MTKKSMTNFRNYLLQFVKDTDKRQTHLSFNRGKYNVPDEEYETFYKKYYEALKGGEDLYLIEKVYNANFKFFMDLDLPKGETLVDGDVKEILQNIKNVINEMFKEEEGLTECVVSKRENRYHLNFYNLIVDSVTAKTLVGKINLENVKDKIDVSVYRTGLRLIGAKKKKSSDSVYKMYNIDEGKYEELSYELFLKTIVRVKDEEAKSELKENYKTRMEPTKQGTYNKNIPVRGIENNEVVEEIAKFLEAMKMTTQALGNYNMSIERIYATQNKMGFFCYYVSIKHKHCPFKDREHQRDSYPIYMEINMNGVYVKCYDQDCLRRQYPEEGIRLPENFENEYPQLYLSMCTRYWKTELTLTEENKRYLEDSLKGSHYQIAKAAFQIYQNRFRIDDVKNVTWYEFDGVRWNKSHAMNILISEELPKYYKGIKISDTSASSSDNLKDFLINDGKMEGNLRNQLVDNIITKLENVNFKNNILNQLAYLYKTHDPEFYNNLDSNPYLLGFKNGVYDFQQNVFRTSRHADYITFSTGYDYIDYEEDAPQVQEIYEFLKKIIPSNRVREYMLKVLGKALVGIPEEKFYIWTGISGANGKSTLVNFLEYTLGDYATSVDVSLLTNKRANASNASPDVVRLRGKRLFTFQEPEHDDKLRTGILKQFTGGDTIIARELFKAPVTFKLQGTMLMCCNDLPVVNSVDGGTFRRLRVVEFKSRFCENPTKENEHKIDPSVKFKIKEWRPYFMSILIHWYNRYLYEGMDEPDEVKKATTKYKVDNDKFNEFFDQCLEESQDSGAFELIKNIYINFQSWWSSNYPGTRIPEHKDLKRAMKIKYGSEKEKVVNGTVQYGFNVKVHIENFEDIDSGYAC
jgi:P4 family phage/plasmid primase-like protien